MSNNIKSEMNKIDVPKELHERSKSGIHQAKNEMSGNHRYWMKGMVLAAGLLVMLGGYGVYKNTLQTEQALPNNKSPQVIEGKGIVIPAIELPDTTSKNESYDMIGLIVYNGKIYTQTATSIEVEEAKSLLGEKLGRTKGTIDEWSSQDEYSKEFASSIGEMDVYTAKGYDKDFRIMVYSERGGDFYAEFYECLNGITIATGQDVFGKLKIDGNLLNAQYRKFSDWDFDKQHYYPINDPAILQSFVEALNQTVPHPREGVEAALGDFRNDDGSKELILNLQDGSKISLFLIKGGFIRYGFTDVYFKMENETFINMWDQMNMN
ncbi:hypothetical protein V7114_11235 [Neobacillus niacini]|uniref:hypothetical protein n=1 Tax=Neobacillus niacini TaxID=86668 RepID=UPI003000EBD2